MKCYLFLFICLYGTVVLLTGCSSTGSYTSIRQNKTTFYGEVTKKCINYEGIERNPVIVVHGFLGANLIDSKTGDNLWGNFSWLDLFGTSDENKRKMAHPMGYKKSFKELKQDTVPNGILEVVNVRLLLGIPIKLAAYKKLIDGLVNIGYQADSRPLPKDKNYYSLFEFAYDWRRDLTENAQVFNQFIEEKRKYLQKKYKELYGIDDFNVQFDVIAHSMGGLLSRYYLRYGAQDLPDDGSLPELNWYGCKYFDCLIVAGAPNAGYLDSFIEMMEEHILQPFSPVTLGTFPAFYQMLPTSHTKSIVYSDTNEAIDVFDPEIWKEKKWGIVNPKEDEALKVFLPNIKTKEERSKIAYDHLSKCLIRAKQFIKAMSINASPPDDTLLLLVYGNGFKTSRRVHINRETGKIEKIIYSNGDGKVLASSAIWDERVGGEWSFFLRSPIGWGYLLDLRAAHMGILETPVFQDNILLLLSTIETQKQKKSSEAMAQTVTKEKQTSL